MDYRIDFGSIGWESPITGMRQKAFVHEGKRLRLVEYSNEMEPHWCERGHFGYVLEGELEIVFETVTHQYRKGDGLFIPAGKEHRHMGKVTAGTALVIFVEDL
ncbi:MAG: cupin domain-containing protein [bacterium]|nr:MAG: cupin domain-containing protein [bacterium]